MGQDVIFLLIVVPESVVNIFYSIFQRPMHSLLLSATAAYIGNRIAALK